MLARLTYGLLTVLIAATMLLGQFVTPLSARGAAPPELAGVNREVQTRMDASRVPGLAMAIVQSDQIIHAQGSGKANDGGQFVTPQTPFVLGSTSKSFTALAIMQLVEAGKLDLDTAVRRYLPAFRLDGSAADAITVRHLLNQTSGIPASAGGEAYRSTRDVTEPQALQALSNVKLTHAPGTAFEYANPNYVLLGFIIEAVSGQSYGDYLQQHVFVPLEMQHSYTALDQAKLDGLAQGHRYWFGVPVSSDSRDLTTLVPAGYIISSAEDLSHYLMIFLNGGSYHGRVLLSPAGIAELLHPVASATLGPWADGAKSSYAMGWFVGGPWGNDPIIFHPGEPPNYTSMLVLAPDHGWGMVMLMNAGSQLPLPGADGALNRIPSEVASLMLGRQPTAGMSLERFYVIFDLLVLAVIAVQIWSVVRLLRHRLRLEPQLQSVSRPLRLMSVTVPLIWEVGLGALLLATPELLKIGWRAAWLWMPDLSLVLLVVGTLSLMTGAVRLSRLTQVILADRSRLPGVTASKRAASPTG